MSPRVRRSNPDRLDLSDPAAQSKFISDSFAGSEEIYNGYTEQMLESGVSLVAGPEAFKTLKKVEDYLYELSNKCINFCPHISSLPFPRPHFWVPAWKVVTCLTCAPEWEKDHQANELCDLCLLPSTEFIEMNIQMGPGVLVFHLGDCCIGKFIN